MNDLPLARRLLAEEESAFEEFFADNFPRLYRFALPRVGGDESAAEEVVQAVLIKAVAKLHTYRGEAALFTWLCTFCRREVAIWRERAGRSGEVALIEDHPDVRAALEALALDAGNDAGAELRRMELSRLVHATLDHLPRRYRDVLEWKYMQGLPVGEIAARLELGYKAAESLLTRARQAFREGFAVVSSPGVHSIVTDIGLDCGADVRAGGNHR